MQLPVATGDERTGAPIFAVHRALPLAASSDRTMPSRAPETTILPASVTGAITASASLAVQTGLPVAALRQVR